MNYNRNNRSILRTPLMPYKNNFTELELKKLYSTLKVQEALYLSSVSLYEKCIKWLNEEDVKEKDKLINSLLKYALRMHVRCTPFGLYAGCGVINSYNEAVTLNANNYFRKTRLDMNFVCNLISELSKSPHIFQYLKYYPNTSYYKVNDKLRYVEYNYINKKRSYKVSSVDFSIYLEKIIEESKKGKYIEQLIEVLCKEDIPRQDAEEFIHAIIDNQILVSELEPAVIGSDLLKELINTLLGIYDSKPDEILLKTIKTLQETENLMKGLDLKIGNIKETYLKIENVLKQLEVSLDLNNLFQTDMFFSQEESDETISHSEPGLKEALRVLNKLTHSPVDAKVTNFKNKFYDRYEESEVSLLKVLDPEFGIGYGMNDNENSVVNPLVDNLVIPSNQDISTNITWDKIQQFLFNKLTEATTNKNYIIQLTLDELKDFKENWDDLPNSFSVMYSHLGKDKDNKNLLKVDSAGGSSAVSLLGRFGTGNPNIKAFIREIAEEEQVKDQNAIYAEIAHLPENRTGNVLVRPHIRKFEIPYLSNSKALIEDQIPLQDIYISVKREKIILRSKRLNIEIIPRLGNAHNFSYNTLPIYNFLCDYQFNNLRKGLFFNWGSFASSFTFLPRVVVDNVIISLAKWQLKKEDFKTLLEPNYEFSKIQIWRDKYQMPQLIQLVDGDNKLLIDFSNELSVGVLKSTISNRSSVVFEEFVFDAKNALVKDENGHSFTNEIIAIMEKSDIRKISPKKIFKTQPKESITRNFSLGSEWVYYKLYCGIETADKILSETLFPLAQDLKVRGFINYWFFIRFHDDDSHLRIRFHLTDLKYLGALIEKFNENIKQYEDSGQIWKLQTDTYRRELERYGVKSMVLSEKIFFHDSMCTMSILENMKSNFHNGDVRWLLAIKSIDNLLNNFNYSLDRKKILLEFLKVGFASEFNSDKFLKKQLNKKYNAHKSMIRNLIRGGDIEEYQDLFSLINQRSINISPMAEEILQLNQNKELEISIDELIASYIHMLVNRLFKSQQRKHEMVIYDFMFQAYKTETIINRN